MKEGVSFRSFFTLDGLPHNKITALAESHCDLRISTAKGLTRLDPETEAFRNFDTGDGLYGNIFYIRRFGITSALSHPRVVASLPW